jgi:hypothetical protein
VRKKNLNYPINVNAVRCVNGTVACHKELSDSLLVFIGHDGLRYGKFDSQQAVLYASMLPGSVNRSEGVDVYKNSFSHGLIAHPLLFSSITKNNV